MSYEEMLRKIEEAWEQGYATALGSANDRIGLLLHEEPCDCDTCRAIVTAQALVTALGEERSINATHSPTTSPDDTE